MVSKTTALAATSGMALAATPSMGSVLNSINWVNPAVVLFVVLGIAVIALAIVAIVRVHGRNQAELATIGAATQAARDNATRQNADEAQRELGRLKGDWAALTRRVQLMAKAGLGYTPEFRRMVARKERAYYAYLGAARKVGVEADRDLQPADELHEIQEEAIESVKPLPHVVPATHRNMAVRQEQEPRREPAPAIDTPLNPPTPALVTPALIQPQPVVQPPAPVVQPVSVVVPAPQPQLAPKPDMCTGKQQSILDIVYEKLCNLRGAETVDKLLDGMKVPERWSELTRDQASQLITELDRVKDTWQKEDAAKGKPAQPDQARIDVAMGLLTELGITGKAVTQRLLDAFKVNKCQALTPEQLEEFIKTLEAEKAAKAAAVKKPTPAPTPAPVPPKPAVPTNLVVQVGDGQLELAWDASADATGYHIEVVEHGKGAFQRVASVTGTSGTLTGLTNGQDYGVRVIAHNATGSESEHLTDGQWYQPKAPAAAPATP